MIKITQPCYPNAFPQTLPQAFLGQVQAHVVGSGEVARGHLGHGTGPWKIRGKEQENHGKSGGTQRDIAGKPIGKQKIRENP